MPAQTAPPEAELVRRGSGVDTYLTLPGAICVTQNDHIAETTCVTQVTHLVSANSRALGRERTLLCMRNVAER